MTMSHTPDHRARRIAKALDSVKAAQKARSLFDNLDDGSRLKSDENDNVTRRASYRHNLHGNVARVPGGSRRSGRIDEC